MAVASTMVNFLFRGLTDKHGISFVLSDLLIFIHCGAPETIAKEKERKKKWIHDYIA